MIAGFQNINTDSCNSLAAPFRELCKVAKAFGDIVIAMNDKEFNPSQKYVVLKDMVQTNSCNEFNSEIMTELSRLESMPWLKSTAFGVPVAKAQERYACTQPVQTSSFSNDRYVRLVVQGEERAFATIQLDSNNNIIKFKPLMRLNDIANLPPNDPCVSLARAIANLPDGSPEAIARLQKRMERLRVFDQMSTIPAYSEPSFTSNKSFFVRQGEGKVSDGPLHTHGMMPCVGVAVMNKETGKAFLIHADATTDVKSIIDRLTPQLGEGKLEAVIAGGDPNPASRDTLYNILLSLDENKINLNGYRPNPGIDGLAVDPASGNFY